MKLMKPAKLILLLINLIGAVNHCIGQDMTKSWTTHKEMEEISVFRNIPWQNLGPTFQGGRIETIDCPVGQPGVIYAGFGSGNLWKTTDGGLHWSCIFENQPSFTIGDVAVSPSDPDIVYLGTGEGLRASRGFTFTGSGIYRSENGGKTWSFKGLEDSHHIGRVLVDPSNPELVFVAVLGHMWSSNPERGLFMSSDGGDSWEKILFINDNVGVSDVVWDHKSQLLYAATWEMPQGPGSGIYRSGDLGKSWEKLSSGFPGNPGMGRIGLAISASQPQTLYAVADNRNFEKNNGRDEITGAEVYLSTNSGMTWQKTHEGKLDIYSGFGWAFGDIRVSPFDRKEIYVLGIHTLHSKDGGKTFSRLQGTITHLVPNPGDYLHLDHHDLFIDPNDPECMILGSDGGLFLTWDKGENWLHCNNIPVGEFYDFKVQDGNPVMGYGGTQDNSCVYGPLALSRPIPYGFSGWNYVWLDPWSGGDGFITVPDPTDMDVIFYESQNGNLNRKNMITGKTDYVQPKTGEGETPIRTSWLTPYFLSLHQPGTVYYGANRVYKSINRGTDWYKISPDLSYPGDSTKKSRALTAIAESPVKPGLLFAGTEKGAMWVSRDDGNNWIDISNNLPVKAVNQIIPSRHREGLVYLVMKALDEDDYLPYLFISENRGASWKSISNGIPDERINCLVEDPERADLIYIGTDRGVYLSASSGASWSALSSGLTTCSVQKLVWADGGDYLLAATHGQSLFGCYASPIRKFYKSVDPEAASLLSVQDGYLPGTRDFSGDFDWNRHIKAIVAWYQPSSGDISLHVGDPVKRDLAVIPVQGKSGINYWYWNMILSETKDSSLYPVNEYKFPAPGQYEVTIEGQGIKLKTGISIR